jgi:hypothetical protein
MPFCLRSKGTYFTPPPQPHQIDLCNVIEIPPIGRLLNQQGACTVAADYVGHGVRVRPQRPGGSVRRPGQQADRLPAVAGGRQLREEKGGGHPHLIHLLLPIPRLRQSGLSFSPIDGLVSKF